MSRIRVIDFRNSRGPEAIGMCSNDPRIPGVIQTAQTRLLNAKEAGGEGWWGSWAEMAFSIDRFHPYLTTPRDVARLEAVAVCGKAIQVNNSFFEYLQFGNGRMPKFRCPCGPNLTEAYSRNVVPTFVDIGTTPQYIQVFATDPADISAAKRVLIQGLDQNESIVYSQDGTPPVQVLGNYYTLISPFLITPITWSKITGMQKDVTVGPVQFFKVDPTTGASELILTMEPSEQVAAYRRYFFNPVPRDCCGGNTVRTITVTALAALEALPLVADTDYLLLQGDGALEAIIEECQAVRYSTMDTPSAKQMSRERHNMAIQLLNGTLSRYLGLDDPAVNFAPMGSARLKFAHVGMI